MKTRHVACALVVALLWASTACDDAGTLAITCPAGSVLCGAQCSDLQGDPANCGMCGNVCAQGLICDLGNCTGAGFDAGIAVDGSKPPGGDAGHDGVSDGGGDGASDSAGEGPNDSATMEGGGPG